MPRRCNKVFHPRATRRFPDLTSRVPAYIVTRPAGDYYDFIETNRDGQVIVIVTNGIWERHNNNGEMFGKETLMEIIRNNQTASARQIVGAVTEGHEQLRGDEAPEDNITLVVIKVDRLLPAV